MEFIQDNITYKIDGVKMSWKGTSPFQKPFFNGAKIVESITPQEIDAIKVKEDKEDLKRILLSDKVVIWQGFIPDETKECAVILGNDMKLSVIQI